MEIKIAPGRYVIAVSGGVDSMVLLHALKDTKGVELIVAHFDHGIRPDSDPDRKFVESEAKKCGLRFEFAEGKLGAQASEALARKARYGFLNTFQAKYSADAIITAHHQDDVLETAILNLSRGTGWRGLIALNDTNSVRRPLLNITKVEILNYAHANDLEWREDSTNTDEKYLRNYIRNVALPQFGPHDRIKLIGIVTKLRSTGNQLDELLSEVLQEICVDNELDREVVRDLPEEVQREILITWWRLNGLYSYESKTLKRVLANIQANKSGMIVPLKGKLQMLVGRTNLALIQRER